MFQVEDKRSTFLGEVKTDSLKENPPAGLYKFSHTMTGWLIKSLEPATDTYIPLPSAEMELVRQEISEFFNPDVIKRTKDAGFVNKRGILMYGPPGTGKTRMMTHIVQQEALRNNAIAVSGITPDGDLKLLVEGVRLHSPNRPIIVIWDEFEDVVKVHENDLLRWLDGVESVDNILFIACLNDIEKVPSRIYARPSRFSLAVEFGHPTPEMQRAYIRGIYGDVDQTILDQLLPLVKDGSLDFVKEVAFLAFIRDKSPDEIKRRLEILTRMA